MIDATSLQFAVVREDPRVEATVLAELANPRRALLIASGGCTALALHARHPNLELTLVDPNPAQIEHVFAKARARSKSADVRRFGVDCDDPDALHERGNFERLFRALRNFLDVFVIDAAERRRRFETRADWTDVFASPYWPVAFDLAFHDSLLVTMFGPDAVQHAVPGSYPRYFQRQIEAGLMRDDSDTNPFLHHLMLGLYLPDSRAWPDFLKFPPKATFDPTILEADMAAVPSFGDYDFIHLSNILDWMSDEDCHALAERLRREVVAGAAVCWRQLNDPRNLRRLFAQDYEFDEDRDARLLALDRSLFYDRIHVGIHN